MNPHTQLPRLSRRIDGDRNRGIPTLVRRVLADIGGGVSLQALESRVSRLGQALSVWRRRRAAVRELSVLSDHMLKDIGLHRSEIRSVVEELLGSESSSRVKTMQKERSQRHLETRARRQSTITARRPRPEPIASLPS